MTNSELIELVSSAVAKDNAAMERLYKAYYTDVYYICKKYNLNDADAADIAQDTFIQGFDKLYTLDNATKFPAWICRIAANKCLNLLKHNNVLTTTSMYDENEELIDIPDDNKVTEDIVVDNEVKDTLTQMMLKLPIEQRVTLFMYYYQDYSIKEIAEAYGCSENTVKSRLNYAKKAMRTEAQRLEENGVKLRVVAILPFLYAVFKSERDAFACEIPDCTAVICKVMGQAAQGIQAAQMAQAAQVSQMPQSGQAAQAAQVSQMPQSAQVAQASHGAQMVNMAANIGSAGGTAVKVGISKGIIAAISALSVGIVAVVVAIIIATSGGDDSDNNNGEGIIGKVTTKQQETTDKENDDDITTEEVTTEKSTTEETTTEEITTEEVTTEYVEEFELREVESIAYIAPSVMGDEEQKADLFWDLTEEDLVKWYKDKGYYNMTDNPKVTISGKYGRSYGTREYIIRNEKKDEETYELTDYSSIVIKTGSYNSNEPHSIQFRYDGQLDEAVANVTEFIEYIGLGEYAEELLHASNNVKIKTEDGKGSYTVDTYYHYDKYSKTHAVSFEIWFYATSLKPEIKCKATNMQYIEDFFDLSKYLTESEYDVTSIEALKMAVYNHLVNEVDSTYTVTTNILESEYTYTYYPESDMEAELKFEYNTDLSQDGVTFNNNRFNVSSREYMGVDGNSLYINIPANAPYDHSVLKYEDMTEEDYVSTAKARQKVLKKLFPSIDFSVDDLVNAMKNNKDGKPAYIEFESGGYKCSVGCTYDDILVGINVE